MTHYGRVIYPSPFHGITGDQELRTGAVDKMRDVGVAAHPKDLAAALAHVSDEWLFYFLWFLRKMSHGRAFYVAAFLQQDVESSPAGREKSRPSFYQEQPRPCANCGRSFSEHKLQHPAGTTGPVLEHHVRYACPGSP